LYCEKLFHSQLIFALVPQFELIMAKSFNRAYHRDTYPKKGLN